MDAVLMFIRMMGWLIGSILVFFIIGEIVQLVAMQHARNKNRNR